MGFKQRVAIATFAAIAIPAMAFLQTNEAVAGSQCGKASWYKMGVRTASGERMNPDALAGAHRTLPFGTKVKVENLANGKIVTITINDRGPFVRGRVIDVTQAAARRLDFIRAGVARVKVTVVGGRGSVSGGC